MQVRASTIVGALVALALGSTGCARMVEEGDLEAIGLSNASSEPPPGLLFPVPAEDLVAIHDRGRRIHQLERALVLAYEEGMNRVGDPGTDAVLPLVDVDPGGRSAQVLFIRWRPGLDGQMPPLRSDAAERWLMVSLLLSPDQVLDVEILTGALPEGSHLANRVDTLVAAAGRARDLAPGVVFHFHDLYEQVPIDPDKPVKGDKIVGRVYALSADGQGADLELAVEPPHRRHDALVLGGTVVHEPGAALADPIAIQTPTPGPLTVARVMARGLEAGPIGVQTPRGRWQLAGGTGVIQRAESSESSPP
ncbi:MAG: hypothetical protein AB1Z98_27240 [Nannocystaceae bacterium]